MLLLFLYYIVILHFLQLKSCKGTRQGYKQDKGRGLVVIDRKIYIEKCLNLIDTYSFIQLDHDPAKVIAGKIQRFIVKITTELTKQEYSRFYRTGSSPGNFMVQPDDTNLKKGSSIDDLSLLDQIFLLGMHHINWLNTWKNSFFH